MSPKKSRTPFFRRTPSLNQRGSIAVPHIPHPHVQGGVTSYHLNLSRYMQGFIVAFCLLGGGMQLASFGFAASGLIERNVAFDYSSQVTCVSQPTLFPSSHQQSISQSFSLSYKGGVALGGTQLSASKICVTAEHAPQPESVEKLPFSSSGIPLLGSSIVVSTDSGPRVVSAPDTSKPIAVTERLQYELDTIDNFFSYELGANNTKTSCEQTNTTISCDSDSLNLEQSEKYAVQLLRTFNGVAMPSPAATDSYETVTALNVASTDIAENQLLYTKPNNIIVTFDKPVLNLSSVTMTRIGSETPLTTLVTINEEQATISFAEPLAREATFSITITDAVAEDEGVLPKPFVRTFRTSGGPKVTGTSLGSYGTSSQPTFSVTFDSPLQTSDAAGFFTATANNQPVSKQVSISGNTATISITEAIGRCTNYSIGVSPGLANAYGVAGGAAWNRQSRTLCQSIGSIGTSQQGRSLTSYSFGTGGKTILFVGGTHGNEQSSYYTLVSWIDALEAQFDRIPSDVRVIVVPDINPDGRAVSDRRNANGVDLNRNFPANNWKKDVTIPGGELVENGGGTGALSEPESQAIANFTTGLNPSLVLTYHARGSYAIANESGNSLAKATEYGSLSGFTALGNSSIAGIFNYDTTGAYEDWLHDGPGIPALLIELTTSTGNEFGWQESAMWAMIE